MFNNKINQKVKDLEAKIEKMQMLLDEHGIRDLYGYSFERRGLGYKIDELERKVESIDIRTEDYDVEIDHEEKEDSINPNKVHVPIRTAVSKILDHFNIKLAVTKAIRSKVEIREENGTTEKTSGE